MPTPAALKLSIALHGVRVDPQAAVTLAAPTLGTLELRLPGGLQVAATPADDAPLVLTHAAGRYSLGMAGAAGEAPTPVVLIPAPAFYMRRTARGIPMWRVGVVQGNRLVVSPSTTSCGYSTRGTPCAFCIEGARPADQDTAIPADVIEVVRAAFDEGAPRLVCFSSAFTGGDDGGLAFLLPYVEAVRRHFDTLVAAQIHPPRTDRWIDRAYAFGIDALGFNLEFFDRHALTRHCVGRARYIGRERYLEALAHAATIFPRGAVWSDLVLGLEPAESTADGVRELATLGVVPVLTGARGAPLGGDAAAAARILGELHRAGIANRLPTTWVAGAGIGFSPDEARLFASHGARRGVGAVLTRSRPGALAARYLARVRRRLRVRAVEDAGTASH